MLYGYKNNLSSVAYVNTVIWTVYFKNYYNRLLISEPDTI